MARILSFFTVSIISDSPGAGYFYRKIKDARKVLVLDLGFLGDTVQLIPACYRIRQALPEAELHVMVADHIKDVLKLTPWIDKILGYPRFPKSESLLKDLPRVRQLRAARYDAVINVNGSDRSSILTAFTRARHRLGRVPPKVSLFWKWCYTDWVSAPFGQMPVYRARCQCLDKAGFPPFNEEFGVVVPDELKEKARQRVGLDGGYVHVSPFTTLDYKELPLPLLTAFLNRLQADNPGLKLVLSCAPNERERGKFRELLARLDFEPWRTFSGDLSLLEVAAVIAGARLHLGGDSGAMNLAFMVGSPTFTWFRNYENLVEWMPDGVNHSHVIGEATDEGLQGIGIDEMVGTVQDALAKV
ncbi:glycosyltransferase family 9 protein [Ruficoccus amylovorans]|uniref:Glycosyltransferase family 9 protein n=1 Tax=Ruficoccus amylovorans TaxID=1804625 RepID=A0A842HFP1_9BACT|nr:glycosyltransferase family 9 protein [Ruficoccus amylovorans]MBC2594858.1 glycosyltransferase family 9 protein [Ruficoccus amylovorans]